MGKAKANSKAAEKKRERLELEKKMNARVAIVKVANDASDALENLPSFKVRFWIKYRILNGHRDYRDSIDWMYLKLMTNFLIL